MTNQVFINKWNKYETIQEKLDWLKQRIISIYSNKELIAFMDKLIKFIPEQSQKIDVLHFAKKIVQQYSREPDREFLYAFSEEFAEDEEEEKKYNPLEWIEIELEYQQQMIGQSKQTPVAFPNKIYEGEKEVMKLEEILSALGISKSTLDRWRTEGCPVSKRGRKLYSNKRELVSWIENNKNKKSNHQ